MGVRTKAVKPSKREQARLAEEILKVKTDVCYFLENYVWTLNEDADTKSGESPIQRFPTRIERPDLYEIAELWQNADDRPDGHILGLDKSRQMMGTWVLICCDLWDTAFHHGVRTFFQSKKEKDATNLLERAWFVFQRLPEWLKAPHQKLETELKFSTLDSIIWAIPQGGDHIRSYTASNIFSDEAAKQPEFGEAYAASIPSIGKHGRFHFLSTARGKGNAFYRLRKKPPSIKEVDGFPTLRPKVNNRNITTAFLGYRLNPKYDEAWISRIKPTMAEDEWNREYEGSYEEAVGTVVWKVDPLIHFRNFDWVDGNVFWRGWDFGFRKPACIVTQMNLKKQWCWIWGAVGEDEYLKDFAPRMFEMCDAKFPPGRDANGKIIDQLWLDRCDWAGAQENDKGCSVQVLQEAHEKRYGKSERYKRMNLEWRRLAFEVGRDLVGDRLKLRGDQEPGLLIHDDFQEAKDALTGGYHYPEDRQSGAKPEYPEDDGFYIHLMDAARAIATVEFNVVEPTFTDERNWPKPWEESYKEDVADLFMRV